MVEWLESTPPKPQTKIKTYTLPARLRFQCPRFRFERFRFQCGSTQSPDGAVRFRSGWIQRFRFGSATFLLGLAGLGAFGVHMVLLLMAPLI